jgi:hypothetical protein
MPKITISKETYNSMVKFKEVVEAIIDEKMNIDSCAELILRQGMDAMLAALLSSQDQDTLLQMIQQLGSQYPAQVYKYVAEVLKKGAVAQEQASLKRQLGFALPTDADADIH